MTLNKIKYFGLSAAMLMSVSPLAADVANFATQPTQEVHAASTTDQNYQNSLSAAFQDTVNLMPSDLKSLVETTNINIDPSDDNTFIFNNFDKTTPSKGLFKDASANTPLDTSLNDSFLKKFVKFGAQVGYLPNENYKTEIKVSGTGVSGTTTKGILQQLGTLQPGNSFKVSLITKDSSGNVVGTKDINVNIVPQASKINLATVPSISVANGADASPTQNSVENSKSIKDVNGNPVFTGTDLTDILSNGKIDKVDNTGKVIGNSPVQYLYAVNGSDDYSKNAGLTSYNLSSFGITNGSSAVVTQLIPVPYTEAIAAKYNDSNFVFLDNNYKVTNKVPAASSTAVAYIARKVIIGTPDSSQYPVFRYTTVSGSTTTTSTLQNGATLTLNDVDKSKLSFKYNDQDSFNNLTNYLKGDFQSNTNGAGNLEGYLTVDSNNNVSNKGNISISYPDGILTAKTSPQYATASITNPTTGITSTLKIPITVTNLPQSLVAPTVTKFPDSAVSVNSKTTSTFNPLNNITATYVGNDGQTHNLTSDNIKVQVKDSDGGVIALNSDGTLSTNHDGVFTITYTFQNPDDTSKTTTKTLTLNVSSTNLTAPTVNGFTGGTYTVSNVNNSSLDPFSNILKNDQITAFYVNDSGQTVTITKDKIKVQVKDQNGNVVNLNSDGTIPLTKAGTYTVSYTFANGSDTTKTTTNNLSLIVNSVNSGVPKVTFSNGMTQNQSLTTLNTSFDPLKDITFQYSFNDSTSDGSLPVYGNVPKESIAYKVTKDGNAVTVKSDGTFDTSSAGTYKIDYIVINPLNNAAQLKYERTVTVTASTPTPTPTPDYTTTDETGVLYINYVWGYGVNLWTDHTVDNYELNPDGSIRKLETGTAWQYFKKVTYSNGDTWYNVGKNQWVSGQYASLTPLDDGWTVIDLDTTGYVSYIGNYGINVWTNYYSTDWTKKLPNRSEWKVFKKAVKGNSVFYNLGGNQWVDGQYFNLNR